MKVCLTVDVESLISLKQGNPSWNFIGKTKGFINNAIKNFRYDKYGFKKVYKIISNYHVPCTFMLVGALFKPLEKKEFIEWGYHTYNHKPLILLNDSEIEKEIENIYDAKSFTAPMWWIEDINNDPRRIFKMLKQHGYKTATYRGINEGVKSYHKYLIEKPIKRFGMKCIHVSRSFEGTNSASDIKKIKSEIINNLHKDKEVYLLSTHDFTHKNINNLIEIVNLIKKLEKKEEIEIIKLNEA